MFYGPNHDFDLYMGKHSGNIQRRKLKFSVMEVDQSREEKASNE